MPPLVLEEGGACGTAPGTSSCAAKYSFEYASTGAVALALLLIVVVGLIVVGVAAPPWFDPVAGVSTAADTL